MFYLLKETLINLMSYNKYRRTQVIKTHVYLVSESLLCLSRKYLKYQVVLNLNYLKKKQFITRRYSKPHSLNRKTYITYRQTKPFHSLPLIVVKI